MTDTTQAAGLTDEQERQEFNVWRNRFVNETGFLPNEADAWKARAALAAQAGEAKASVPAGYKPVPIEPTEEMANLLRYDGIDYTGAMTFADFKQDWAEFLASLPVPTQAKAVPAGANEQLYRIDTGDGRAMLADNRDGTKRTFLPVLPVTASPAPAEAKEERKPNPDEVICPACTHQFRAIPENVQAQLQATPQPQAAQPVAHLARDPGGYLVVVAGDSPNRPSLKPFPVYTAAPALTEEQVHVMGLALKSLEELQDAACKRPDKQLSEYIGAVSGLRSALRSTQGGE